MMDVLREVNRCLKYSAEGSVEEHNLQFSLKAMAQLKEALDLFDVMVL